MQLSALARRNPLTAIILTCTLIILLWRQAANSACSGGSCYRLGNFIDFWLQRELLRSLDVSTSGPAGECSQILRGIQLRRFFRIEWLQSRSLIERISSLPLPQAPTFWNDPSSAPLRQTLQEWDNSNRDSYPFVWWNIAQLKLVLPYLKPVLRTLVDGAFVEADQTTCVVHFRTGDFFSEQRRGWNKRQLHLSIAALIAAARTLPQLPRRFEVLGGGRDHNCDITTADCGTGTLRLIANGLRRAYPSAEVALVGGSADDDFLRAASAPMLLIGCDGMELVTGSSFAVYAAAASNGHVRSPACFLRFGACMKANNVDTPPLAPNWLGYPHPNCKECREEMKTDPTQWAVIQAALDEMGEARVADSSVSKWLAEGKKRRRGGG